MDKRKKILALVALLLISIVVFYILNQNKTKDNNEEIINEQTQEYIDNTNTAEEEKEVEHNLKLTIISPEGESFSARQARMYEALIEGNGKYSNQVKCHWEFFLNQNNEEALYQTMDNSGILSGESKEICGFTSTFIESKGILRVKLTVTVFDAVNENIESVSGERTYTVL